MSLSPCPSLALFARGIVGQAAGAAQPLQRCLPRDWALIPPGFPRAGSPPGAIHHFGMCHGECGGGNEDIKGWQLARSFFSGP